MRDGLPQSPFHAPSYSAELVAILKDQASTLLPVGSSPFWFDDPELIWIVDSGYIDVMSAEVHDQQPISTRMHLFRVEANQYLFGVSPLHERKLMGIGGPEAKVIRISRKVLLEVIGERNTSQSADQEAASNLRAEAFLEAAVTWIAALSTALVHEAAPKDSIPLLLEESINLESGQSARPHDALIWVRDKEGSSQFMSHAAWTLPSETYIPITDQTWLTAGEHPARLITASTQLMFQQGLFWQQLNAFHQLAQQVISTHVQQNLEADQQRLQKRQAADKSLHRTALEQIASPLARKSLSQLPELDRTDGLVAACQRVGASAGITIITPKLNERSHANLLDEIVRASHIRTRQVALSGDWWRLEAGPLLGYREDKQPVALLPRGGSSYAVVDPLTGDSTLVTAEVAATLSPFAWSFYRSFPSEKLIGWQLVYFGMRGSRKDLAAVIALAIGSAVISAVIPLATAYVFDHIVPQRDYSQLMQIGIFLLVTALGSMIFQITRGVATLRIEARFDHAIQPALWDRLLNLPTTFFRDYSSGDLAQRLTGMQQLKSIISGPGATLIVTGLTLLSNLILLLSFDAGLTVVVLPVIIVAVLVVSIAGAQQARLRQRINTLQGKLSGTLFQIILGISKFRVASAETRAFALWGMRFSEARKLIMQFTVANARMSVFYNVLPILSTIILFAAFSSTLQAGTNSTTTGQFLAFYTTFAQFLANSLLLGATIIALSNTLSVYERAKPVLETLPEARPDQTNPGELSGSVDVTRLSFCYNAGGVPVLNDVSFSLQRGEFVALVGSSGSGKSTLLRILLGFETPQSGIVQYDGQDLAELDIRAVRRQLGVVLQTSQLLVGSIYENIVGQTGLGAKEALEAARMAGLEADLAQMPMGLYTMVGENGGTLSGGQRQRLMIARALVTKPRILYFDEATSALDNRTQEIITQSLEHIGATRLVIAHRLSTIINADRILVLEKGQLVQSGTYEELLHQSGVFANLAKRQLV